MTLVFFGMKLAHCTFLPVLILKSAQQKNVRLTQLLEFVLNISSSVKNTMYLLLYMTHKIH